MLSLHCVNLLLLHHSFFFSPQNIEHVDAKLDLSKSTSAQVHIQGDVTLTIRTKSTTRITLDAHDFKDVVITGLPHVKWVQTDTQLIGYSQVPISGDHNLNVKYHATPQKGVTSTPSAIWTSFHTWHWLPTFSSPSERSTFSLWLKAPNPSWKTIGTGDGPEHPGPDLVLETPHPSYTFGFFMGELKEPLIKERLAVWGLPKAEASLVWERTDGARARWLETFGPDTLPPQTYTQVFVPGRAAQELAGMAFLSKKYASTLRKNPKEDWLIVHELAHQMWGNLVTCATWGDFWLNEAVVSWWVGQDKKIRGDLKAHAHEVSLWKKRVNAYKAKDLDPRIHKPGANATNAGGGVVYNAGALWLEEISNALGSNTLRLALQKQMQRANAANGYSLSTDTFLESLKLTPTQLGSSKCRLQSISHRCSPL